ncbi:hypothetical protein RN001_000804 [Aquatica leii]|uniref:Uncharacterized protein n=1 Tax=Aquatica leii TaxID=1421715 RepID=A0AAN7SQN6_9COLE|nr:hypothetical protein RN001_000804 [Aquatica leii]
MQARNWLKMQKLVMIHSRAFLEVEILDTTAMAIMDMGAVAMTIEDTDMITITMKIMPLVFFLNFCFTHVIFKLKRPFFLRGI